jgi:16S rRNA (uracil1498-N3)-methyltransferase
MTKRVSRIYVNAALDGETLEIDAAGAHYITRVLRLKVGDSVVVFNGRGIERLASIRSLAGRKPTLGLDEQLPPLPESNAKIVLIQAVIKSDRMDTVVQKATELGVNRVVAVRTEYSDLKLGGDRSIRKLEHWQRITQSACEQSHRHYLPIIEFCDSLKASLQSLPDNSLKIALQNTGDSCIGDLNMKAKSICLCVGPEGGFSPAESALLTSNGFHSVRLGGRILRAETAAIAACSIGQLLWGDFDLVAPSGAP